MKKALRITSLILAIVLLFGCVSTTAFAVTATEVEGGVITEEDIAAGDMTSAMNTLPEANGIMTADQISALIGSANLAGTNDCDAKGTDSNNFQTVVTDEASGRTYIKVHESDYTLDEEGNKVRTTKFACGTNVQTFMQINNYSVNNHAAIAKNYLNYKGRSFVLSFDMRLEKDYNISNGKPIVEIRCYLAAKDGAMTNISVTPISIDADGSLKVSGTVLDKKVNKSTAEAEAEFTNIAIHVIPELNTFEVYVDGVWQTENIDSVLLNSDNIEKMTFTDVKYTSGSTTYTLSADGYKDFTLSWARFMHSFVNPYHGEDCDDSCTQAAAKNTAPINFVGDQYSFDNMKAYYSDIYLECTEHSIEVASEHTHDETNATASATFVCTNCSAKWTASVPMDQTGNSLCDLCEINSKDGYASMHTRDEIINMLTPTTTVRGVSVHSDADKSFTNGGTQIRSKTENGNTYFVIGNTTAQFFTDIANSDTNSSDNFKKNYATSAVRGKSYVLQADLRLGADFFTEKQTFELFKMVSYSTCKKSTTDGTLDPTTIASLPVTFLRLDKSGAILARNGATGSNVTVATLSASTEFTTVAIHIHPNDSKNTCGTYDIYVNGECVKADMQLLTADEVKRLITDVDADGTADINGIGDYLPGFARFFHTYDTAPVVNADVLHADNMMWYYTDTYNGNVTKHQMTKTEHVHDYTENCVSWGKSCSLCGAGDSMVAILDANGDKVCDVCVNEQLDTAANGIIDPSDLASTVDSDNIILSSTITETSPYGFSSVANTAKCISTTTVNGNTYLIYTDKTVADGEAYVDVRRNSSSNAMLNNFDRDSGRSFIYSIDVRLDKDFNLAQNLFQILSYMVPKDYDTNNNPSTFKSLNIIFAKITAGGVVQYRDGATNKPVSTGYTLPIGGTEFTTLSIHVRPGEGEYGLFSLFADGNPIATDIQFLTSSESESISWTTTAGITSEGVKDYNLGFIRSFHVKSDNSITGNFASLDNPKLYYSDTFIECAKHVFSLTEHTHDTDNGEFEASFKCHCGVTENIRLPIDTLGTGTCDTCESYLLEGGAAVTKRQVVLDDLIGINLYALLEDEVLADETAKMVLKVADKTEEYMISDMTPDENGEYTFMIKMSSINMTDDVTMALERGGVLGNAYTTDVRDYAMAVIGESDSYYERDICKAMLNYGAYAQVYFAEKNGYTVAEADLANSMLETSDKDVSDVSAETLEQYRIAVEGIAADRTFTGASLVLNHKTAMKVYFIVDGDFTVTVDGVAADAVAEGEEYYVRIDGILPNEFAKVHTVEVSVGENILTIDLSVLSCVDALLVSDEAESFKQLGRAIYKYNVAALLYDAESTEVAEVVVKDGAKGAVALVFDDGDETAATYVSDFLTKYDKTTASFALITDDFATLTKENGKYVMSEDGKYTYTQTDAEKTKTQYWLDYLAEHPQVEFISHSHTHRLPEDGDNYAELLGARHILQGLFGMDTEAIITPGGFNKTEEYTAVRNEVYIAGRGTNADLNVKTMLNLLSEFDKSKRSRLDSFMIQYNNMCLTDGGEFFATTDSAETVLNAANAANGIADVSHVENFIYSSMENNALAAFCVHGVVPSDYKDGVNTGGLYSYVEQIDAIFAYVQKYAETGELWAANYSEAVKYFCQWNTSELDVRQIGENLISVYLSDGEDDEIFDMELTVKVTVPDSWESVNAACGSVSETLEVKGEAGAKYVLVNILPDSDAVILTAA